MINYKNMKKKLVATVVIVLLFLPAGAFAQQTAVRLGTNSQVTNSIIFENSTANPVSTGVPVKFSASDLALPTGYNNVLLPNSPFGTGFRINPGSYVFMLGNQLHLNAVDTLDLDYNPRVSCSEMDIGAFESVATTTQITSQPSLAGGSRVCEGGSMMLQVQAIGDNLSYQWRKNGVNLPGRVASTFAISNVSIADTGTYSVIVYGDCCNDTSANVRLDVDLKPMLVLMPDTTVLYESDVTLRIIESIGNVLWYHDDMETILLNTTITSIKESMEFVAVATNGVCPDQVVKSVQIIVEGIPCVVRTMPDQLICSGDPYRLFVDTASAEYKWFIAGTTTELPHYSIIRPTEDITLALVGYSENGEVCDTDTLRLTVPQIQLDVRADGTYCKETLTQLSSNPPADRWYDQGGNPIGSGNIYVLPVNGVTTIYTAQRTAMGCTVQKTVAITLNPPDLNFPMGDSIRVCEGEQVNLITNLNPSSVIWEKRSTGQMLPENPTVTALTKEIYRAHAYDVHCGNIYIDMIVDVQPKPTFEILPHADICVGQDVNLVSIPNASRWMLQEDSTRVFMPQTPTQTTTYIGVYVLDKCTLMESVTVTVEQTPSFAVAFRDTTIVEGDALTLASTPTATKWFVNVVDGEVLTSLTVSPTENTIYVAVLETGACGTLYDTTFVTVNEPPAVLEIEIEADNGCSTGDGWAMVNILSGVGPFTYLWNNGATTALIENLSPGNYSVTVTDALGAKKSETATITSAQEIIIAYSTDDPNNEQCTGGNIRVTVTGGNPNYFFDWSSNWEEGIFSHSQNLFNMEAGFYHLLVTDSRGCQKDIEIPLQCLFKRVMPTLFITPNDDGKNDFLVIRHIELYPKNTVTIINSYGEEVITIRNYNNRDRIWNGRNRRGQILPDGTYYYIVQAEGVPPMAGWLLMKLSKRR